MINQFKPEYNSTSLDLKIQLNFLYILEYYIYLKHKSKFEGFVNLLDA